NGLREVRVLGEEPVAWVDRIRAGRLRGADVLLGEEVAADLDRLGGEARVQRASVVRSDDGHRLDRELAARAEDAHGDLAAICDEKLADRRLAQASAAV